MYVPSAGYCLAVVVAGLSASLVILQLGSGWCAGESCFRGTPLHCSSVPSHVQRLLFNMACHKEVPVTTALVIWS